MCMYYTSSPKPLGIYGIIKGEDFEFVWLALWDSEFVAVGIKS